MYPLKLWIVVVCCFCLPCARGILEEFVIRGPDDLNKIALEQLFADRKANPDKDNANFASGDSPLMQRAKSYAIHRGETPSDESLKVVVSDSTSFITHHIVDLIYILKPVTYTLATPAWWEGRSNACFTFTN
jgi:hypothetical protein